MAYQNLTTDKTPNPSLLITLLYELLVKIYNLLQNFCVRTYENSQSGVANGKFKLNPEKPKVIIFSRSSRARNSVPILKLYGERLKIYPQVKFLGITFQNRFEEILGHSKTVSPNQTFRQQKMPVHHITLFRPQ